MKMSEPMNEIASALVVCQSQVKFAAKDANNPHFGKMYADLASVMEAGRDALASAGLALTFNIKNIEGAVELTPLMFHKSGQYIEFDPLAVRLEKATAQGQGSAITYGRRYLYQSILGIASEDDDGNSASGTGTGNYSQLPEKKSYQGQVKFTPKEQTPAPLVTLPDFSGPPETIENHSGPAKAPLPKQEEKPEPSSEAVRVRTLVLQIGALIKEWPDADQDEIRAKVKGIGKDPIGLENLKVEIMDRNSKAQTPVPDLGGFFG